MEITNIAEIALGVVGGIAILGLLNMIVEIPKARANKRKHEQFLQSVRGLGDDVVKAIEEKEKPNARNSSQKAKTSTRSKSTAGNKKATVQKAKKGVSYANKR